MTDFSRCKRLNDAFQYVDDEFKSYIEDMIEKRAEAKREKDFAKADAIREELASKGVVLKDTREGTVWETV